MALQSLMPEVHTLVKHGLIKTFADIFDFVPPTQVARAIDMGNKRFEIKMIMPDTLTELEIKKMAKAFGMEPDHLIKLISAGKSE